MVPQGKAGFHNKLAFDPLASSHLRTITSNIERVEFDAAADAVHLVGGDQRRPRSEERVEDDVPRVSEVEQSVGEQFGGLDGGVILKPAARVGAQRGRAGVSPDVGAPTARSCRARCC